MKTTTQATIRMRTSNERASDQKSLCFSPLEQFANMGDNLSDVQSFRAHWPTFFPVDVYNLAEGWFKRQVWKENPRSYLGVDPNIPLHTGSPLRWYRDQLRKVWKGLDPEGVRLSILLGLIDPFYEPDGNHMYHPLAERDASYGDDGFDYVAIVNTARVYQQMVAMQEEIGNGFLPASPPLMDWDTGRNKYQCDSEFQSALFALMQESWKARNCHHCKKYFIADKTAQMYCSTSCFGDSKRDRDRSYFRQQGSKKRALRLKKKAQRKNS